MLQKLKICTDRFIQSINNPQGVICILIAVAFLFSLTAYFYPIFGTNLEQATRWLGNVTPLVVVFIGYFIKEEISNWHYKKRSEAASAIMGKFKVCSKDLTYWVNARILTPPRGEEAAERKIYICTSSYIDYCLEPYVQFPIKVRKNLDEHFEKMRQLANTLSSAITINTGQQPFPTYGEKNCLKASEDLNSLGSKLIEIQDYLDETLGMYLSR